LRGIDFRAGGRVLSILQILYGLCRRPNFPFYVSWGSFPRLKRQGPKFIHSPLSSAEVQNEWSWTSAPPVCLHGLETDKFTLFTFKPVKIRGLSYKINRPSRVRVLPYYITHVNKQTGHRIESRSLLSFLHYSSHSFFHPQLWHFLFALYVSMLFISLNPIFHFQNLHTA
jgi:hypothetical protein